MQRSVSVVIPVQNDAIALPHAVSSVLAQKSVHVDEIVIVVGPSDDGSVDVAQELVARTPTARLIENPKGKTPVAMNLGAAAARGDVIVRVDARSVLPDDYIVNALDSLEATGAGNVGAVQVPEGVTPVQRAIAAAMRSVVGSGGAAYRRGAKLSRVDTAYLGVFRRAAFEAVGGYDETFERNQDGELNTRLNAAGHQVWLDPRLRVAYRPRASLRSLASQYWQYGWWRQRTLRKNRGSLVLRQMAAPLLLVLIGAALLATVVWSFWAMLVPLGYLGVLVIAALRASELAMRERMVMIAALATMHGCWGAGFIASLLHSVVRRNEH